MSSIISGFLKDHNLEGIDAQALHDNLEQAYKAASRSGHDETQFADSLQNFLSDRQSKLIKEIKATPFRPLSIFVNSYVKFLTDFRMQRSKGFELSVPESIEYYKKTGNELIEASQLTIHTATKEERHSWREAATIAFFIAQKLEQGFNSPLGLRLDRDRNASPLDKATTMLNHRDYIMDVSSRDVEFASDYRVSYLRYAFDPLLGWRAILKLRLLAIIRKGRIALQDRSWKEELAEKLRDKLNEINFKLIDGEKLNSLRVLLDSGQEGLVKRYFEVAPWVGINAHTLAHIAAGQYDNPSLLTLIEKTLTIAKNDLAQDSTNLSRSTRILTDYITNILIHPELPPGIKYDLRSWLDKIISGQLETEKVVNILQDYVEINYADGEKISSGGSTSSNPIGNPHHPLHHLNPLMVGLPPPSVIGRFSPPPSIVPRVITRGGMMAFRPTSRPMVMLH